MAAIRGLYLTPEERQDLIDICNDRRICEATKTRAKIVLLKSQGKTTKAVAAEVGCSYVTAHDWVDRFLKREKGVPLLKVLSSKPSTSVPKHTITPAEEAWIMQVNEERIRNNGNLAALQRMIYAQAEQSGFPGLKDVTEAQMIRIAAKARYNKDLAALGIPAPESAWN